MDKCDRITAVHRGGKLKERYVYNQNDGLIEKYDRNGNCLLKLEPGPYDTHAVIELLDGPKIEFTHDEVARVVAAGDGNCQPQRVYSQTGELILDVCNGKGVDPIGLLGGNNLYGYTPRCLISIDLQGLHPQSASNAGSSPTSEKSPMKT